MPARADRKNLSGWHEACTYMWLAQSRRLLLFYCRAQCRLWLDARFCPGARAAHAWPGDYATDRRCRRATDYRACARDLGSTHETLTGDRDKAPGDHRYP